MSRHPYETPARRFDTAEWARYERANKKAADQYAEMPSAYNKAQFDDLDVVRKCLHCDRTTRAADGQCPRCKRKVVGG